MRRGGAVLLRLTSGRVVGRIVSDVARLRVQKSRHWFRVVGGYSLDVDVLRDIEALGVEVLAFDDSETGETSTIPTTRFREHARALPDYGFGSKLACPERFYDHAEAGPVQPQLFPATDQAARGSLAAWDSLADVRSPTNRNLHA